MTFRIGGLFAQAHHVEHFNRVVAVQPLEQVELCARGVDMADQVFGKDMHAAHQRQRFDPCQIGQAQFTEKMREQRAAARYLPFQGIAKRIGVHGQQHQAILAREMLGGSFSSLFRRREMDEPIGQIDRRTHGGPVMAQGLPFIHTEYLEDQHGPVMPRRIATVKREGFDAGRLMGAN